MPDLHSKREEHTRVIIESDASNKIIVAGAGTGKSFTFKKILETKKGSRLALTFINSLASDLKKELCGLAESRTFHSYCKKLLHSITVEGISREFCYFPKLEKLIVSDAQFLGNNLEKFQDAFQTLAEDQRVRFFLQRGTFYDAAGHDDAVYRVLKYFQSNPAEIPVFSQIVVDEYQDFNLLEVSFINELSKRSPVLIAGDDDQAVYNFKNASPHHIREKCNSFERFELPYCSRCTQVVVDSVHDITTKAQSLAKLEGRIEKQYHCFLPDKKVDNEKYGKIIHVHCSVHTKKAPYVSMFIQRVLECIPEEEIDEARRGGYPCVLIVGPSQYTKQIYTYLSESGFTNMDFKERRDEEVDILDGYKFLLKDKESNLGWRIVLECCEYENKEDIIRRTCESECKLSEILDEEFRLSHLEVVSILEKLNNGIEISECEQSKVATCCERELSELLKCLELAEEDKDQEVTEEDTSISIKITTINGSKGLSANHVFIVGMNNANFPKDRENPTDNEICQFIVGITRTRKRCYLISNSHFAHVRGIQQSDFISWIHSSRIQSIYVNKRYFNKQ
ncbi:MAG: UvrD-helicase domain-containing protein [Candidatus Dadabacteria bacterium]|nr:UvrD-helicase domain-containing protein [Candidatus Dadabacteria bacterium]